MQVTQVLHQVERTSYLLQEDITRHAQEGFLGSGSAILSPPHLRQLHVASVLAQANAITVPATHASSATASLLLLDHKPAPTLPAPLAHAAAAVHSNSRQLMMLALQKDSQYMQSVHTVRESLSSLTGVKLLSEAPTIANLHYANVRFHHFLCP